MASDKNNSPTGPEKPRSSWVWRCTDASINNQQISMLAVFETLIAVGVYWWLALHFEWPWMAFLSMIAAPMCYPLTGLVQLPQNWRETLLVIDFTHPPEFLPQASTINPALSVKKIWAARKASKGIYHLFTTTFIATLYLPALAYRWSLKASAWLWFPLSLALTPPLHSQKAQDSRRKMAILHAWHWPYLLIASVGILWLLSATPLLETWLPLLPPEYATIHANLPAPLTFGFRYALACLGCLLIVLLIIKSKNLKTSHGLILESPNEFNILTSTDQTEFLSIAKSIDRIRLWLIAVLFLWGEMMALGFVHARHPQMIEQFISPALLFYL